VAEEAAEPVSQEEPADDSAPRELMVLVAGVLALACAALVLMGVPRQWTAPTLGVLLILGGTEAFVAIGLAVRCALVQRRKSSLFVPAIAVTALGTIALAGILLLSGII